MYCIIYLKSRQLKLQISMRHTVYLTYNKDTEQIANKISSYVFINRKFYIDKISIEDIIELASTSKTEYFYVIEPNFDGKINFNFEFKPEFWDSTYVHIWNTTSIRLYNRDHVLNKPELYTDEAMISGIMKFKNHDEDIIFNEESDIIFISYDELNADSNFNDLLHRFPKAKRIHGVKGIFAAHKAAAELAESNFFYVVDADAKVNDNFKFNFSPSMFNLNSVYLWYSKNPINDLEYGYGGVKLFSTNLVKHYDNTELDFTTSITNNLHIIPKVSNITQFNTDPFSTWRSAFRECTKLASKSIMNQVDQETEHRLDTWCSIGGDRDFGDFAIMGAKDGRDFGMTNKHQPETLKLINDFDWLAERFSS